MLGLAGGFLTNPTEANSSQQDMPFAAGGTMNKNLLRIGGAISLLFVVIQLGMIGPIGSALASLSPDIRATVSTMNVQGAFILLLFGYLAIFRWRDLLTTRLGHLIAIAICLYWFLRAVDQAVFYGLTPSGVPLMALCVVLGLLHLIPALREWNNVPLQTQHPAEAQVARPFPRVERVGRAPWTSYAIVAWCVVFGGLHLYWALGGNVGFTNFSTPSSKALALTRDPLYMTITWGVVLACAAAAIVALAPFQAWSRRLPRWMLLAPLWIGCGLFLLRGVGNTVQSALIIAGGMPFEVLTPAEMQAWNQWMLLDALLFSPWFILGGLAFGATALSARRQAVGA
jgi:hypothetical protein